MIAVDTSVLVDYLHGIEDDYTRELDETLSCHALILPPVVLAEILSDPRLSQKLADTLLALPLVPLKTDFWQRAGRTRATLIAKKLKARLADTLIAQCCIDGAHPLLTKDKDFRHFVKYAGLVLYL